MADRLGIKTSSILDRESENMAVRMALIETQIIEETKKYLEKVIFFIYHLHTHLLRNIGGCFTRSVRSVYITNQKQQSEKE